MSQNQAPFDPNGRYGTDPDENLGGSGEGYTGPAESTGAEFGAPVALVAGPSGTVIGPVQATGATDPTSEVLGGRATYTYNAFPTTNTRLLGIWRLRRYMQDLDFSRVNVPRARRSVLFSDQDYWAFITESDGDLTIAWNLCLLSVASSAALVAIHVSLGGGGGDVDYGQRAAQLRAQADAVIKRPTAIIDYLSSIPASTYAETDNSPMGASRILENAILRSLF